MERKMLYLKAAEWHAVDEDGHLRSFDILFARGSEQMNYDSGPTDRRTELERKKEKLRQIREEKERRRKERDCQDCQLKKQ